jgi:hypothetical protein
MGALAMMNLQSGKGKVSERHENLCKPVMIPLNASAVMDAMEQAGSATSRNQPDVARYLANLAAKPRRITGIGGV